MANFRRTSEEGSGLVWSNQQGMLDAVTVTVFSGAGFGTGSFELHLYDAVNESGTPFLDVNLSTTGTESEDFDVRQNIRSSYLYASMTGSGALNARLR